MSHYADSSFLVSCYLTDANTSQAKACLSRIAAPLGFISLHELEVRNAFNLAIFRRYYGPPDIADALRDLQADLRSGRLLKQKVNWPVVFRFAGNLSRRQTAVTGARSLDLLHIAAAKHLGSTDFLSFDIRQRTVAAAVGLTVAP